MNIILLLRNNFAYINLLNILLSSIISKYRRQLNYHLDEGFLTCYIFLRDIRKMDKCRARYFCIALFYRRVLRNKVLHGRSRACFTDEPAAAAAAAAAGSSFSIIPVLSASPAGLTRAVR